MEKIAVLGAGWGGLSITADLTSRGFDVNLWNRKKDRLQPVRKKGGITIIDALTGEKRFIKVDKTKVTTDITKTIKGVELIMVPVPAFAQKDIALKCVPHLEDGQIILLLPGSCGSLEFERVLEERKVEKDITLCESLTLPQSGRCIGPGKVKAAWGFSKRIGKKKMPDKKMRFATFPANKTHETIEALKSVYPYKPAKNVLEVGLLNVNFIIHPAPFVLNIGVIERTNGDISLLNEGMSTSVISIMEAMDAEKMSLCRALRIEAISCDDIYRESGRDPVYRMRENPMEFRDRIPDIKSSRYLIEDVPYGSVLWASLGDVVNVDTPITDSVIRLASIISQRDFMKTGRTVEKLGVEGMTIDELEVYLQEGKR